MPPSVEKKESQVTDESESQPERVFLGEVNNSSNLRPWEVTVEMNGVPMTMKVDTGADVQ